MENVPFDIREIYSLFGKSILKLLPGASQGSIFGLLTKYSTIKWWTYLQTYYMVENNPKIFMFGGWGVFCYKF